MSQGLGQMVCFEVPLRKAQALPQKPRHGHNITHYRYRAVVASYNRVSFFPSRASALSKSTSNSMHGPARRVIFLFFSLFVWFSGGSSVHPSTAATCGWAKSSTAPPPEDTTIRDPNQKAGTILSHRIRPIGPIARSGNSSPKWLGLVGVDAVFCHVFFGWCRRAVALHQKTGMAVSTSLVLPH